MPSLFITEEPHSADEKQKEETQEFYCDVGKHDKLKLSLEKSVTFCR